MTKRAPHARAREDADKGVARCVDLMTSGRWITGRSVDIVAREEGVSPETARRWAANASRIVRASIDGDLDEIRARMLATLDTVVDKALTRTAVAVSKDGSVTAYEAPDLKAAVSAIDTQGKLLGLHTTKLDVTHGGAVMTLSRAEHLRELAKLKAEIELEEARAKGDGG